MNKEQLDKIKLLTGYPLQEITKMNNKEFWQKITGLMVKGRLSPEQYEWLDKQRGHSDLTKQEEDILNIFGGRIIND